MKKGIIIGLVFFCLHPMAAHGDQWRFFERRYSYKMEDVLQADRFVQKKGYWEGYSGNKLVGYVFLSKDWTRKLIGYSGKHMETLIGMDTDGAITGVKIIFHSEPIVLIGLKEENYQKFMKQYPGKNIKENMSVGREISMDAISGATVTAVVHNAIILESARRVASETGMIRLTKEPVRKISGRYTNLTWNEIISSGAVKNLKVTTKELGIEGDDIYLELYFGIVTPPSIGRNILGDNLYKETMGMLKEGESAMVIFSIGKGSFKGSGFARGGVFDRFNIEQDARVYIFTERDYRILTNISAKGAPSIKEGGVFIVRNMDFEPARFFKFNLILPYRIGAKKEFKSFSVEYKIPDRFLE